MLQWFSLLEIGRLVAWIDYSFVQICIVCMKVDCTAILIASYSLPHSHLVSPQSAVYSTC